LPLYRSSGAPIWTTVPIGSTDGSAAATPACAATPAVVTSPLQYAVALKDRRTPGKGAAADSAMTGRSHGRFCESSIVTSYSATNPHAAIAVTSTFRLNDLP